MSVPRKNDKASHKMQTVKPWKNDWTFALNISHRAQCVSTRDKKFLGGKTTKYSPVNIFSAIKVCTILGSGFNFRSLGQTDHKVQRGWKHKICCQNFDINNYGF